MKRSSNYICIALMVLSIISCKPVPVSHWFPVTPLESYEKDLYKLGAEKTQAGQTWFNSAKSALRDTLFTEVPYQERFFLGDSTPAQSIRFQIPEGRSLVITSARNENDSASRFFLELYRLKGNSKPQRVHYLESNTETLAYSHYGADTLLLRVQTGLDERVTASVTISTQPTLSFPVAGHGMQDIISVWGAERDRGIRLHEGIDIRAKRGTPVIASANGFITNAGINTLGGKVIFQSAANSPYSIYYAHLDSQLVDPGKRVSVGDTIGLVGNTGNAITTSPHLHFGVYASGSGALNPLPFINDRKEKIPGLPKPSGWLGDSAEIRKKTSLFAFPSFEKSGFITIIPAYTTLQILGETTKGYRVRLQSGMTGYISTVPFTKPGSKGVTPRARASR